MLHVLRKNTKSIIWTVILSFGLWGAYSVGTQFQKEGRVAGEVFGKNVSFQEYSRFFRAAQIFSFSGKNAGDPERIKQQAWQNLILSREAKRRKVEVTDEEVRGQIYKLLEAQKIENPGPEIYRRWLAATVRETPQDFESQIREMLRAQKLVQRAAESWKDTVTEEEVRRRFLLDHNSVSAELVSFSKPEEAKEFYEGHKTSADWEKPAKQDPKAAAQTGMIALDAFLHLWQVPEDAAFKIHAMEKGAVSEPVRTGGKFSVIHLLDKQIADEEKYKKELREKTMKDLADGKKYRRFLAWSFELQSRAKLKDYLPKPEPIAEPKETPKPSAPASA